MGVRSGPRIPSESREEGGVLLIHSDTTDGSTTFVDSGPSGHAITRYNALHKTAQKKFGATSMYFDGTDDYLSIADHADFSFGTGAFTVDFWMNIATAGNGTNRVLVSKSDLNQRTFTVYLNTDNKIRVGVNGPTGSANWAYNTGSTAITTAGWHHVAVVRNGASLNTYLDGVLETVSMSGTTFDASYSLFDSTSIVTVGAGYWSSSVGEEFTGYLDEIRVSKGIARWTENFKPPHRPYVTRDLVLCLDAMNAKSFAGEPTTNLSANSNYSGASLGYDSGNTGTNWGCTFRRYLREIPGPSGNTVRAFHLYVITGTGGTENAEGGPYHISGMDSQYGSLSSGSTYVASAWAKVIRADGSNTPHTNTNILYLTGAASLGSSSLTVNTEWTRIEATFSISSTGSYRLHHYFYSVSIGDTLVITEPQIELKSYSTPYVLSSRATADSWKDLSGRGNHGTHSAADFGNSGDTVLYQKGQIMLPANVDDITSAPASINFDGTNDCVSWGDITLLDGLRRLTVSVWYKCEGASSSTSVVVFSKDNAVECWIEWSDAQTYTLSINNEHINFTNTTSPIGSWTHAVWTWDAYDGSTGDVRKLYQNGNHIETVTTGTKTGTITNVSNDLAVGGRDNTTNGINGKIAAVQVYSAVLTHAQIKDIYNSQKSRFGL